MFCDENEDKKSLIIVIFILLFITAAIKYNNKSNLKQEESKSYKPIFEINKIIIIGDSRMELINDKREELNIPNSILFIARGGAKISWLYESALPQLYETIEYNKKYKYHIVFNLGVNDLDDEVNIENLAHKYYKIYNSVIRNYKDVLFYFLSVNPVDENRIYTYFDINNKRTNQKIEKLNDYFIKFINKDKSKNIKYCDSYNNLDFYLPDGLHYDINTDKKIVKYIIEKCININ